MHRFIFVFTLSSSKAPCTSKSLWSAGNGGRARLSIEKHETQIETWQIYLVAQREWDRYPTLLDFSIIEGIETAMLATASHQCVHQEQ
jgi:hypothetical protein